MAEHGLAKEALPLALKAVKLSQAPAVLDTVGWIHHLLGEDSGGITYVEEALAGAPAHVDILIHAAVMHAALNSKARARNELDERSEDRSESCRTRRCQSAAGQPRARSVTRRVTFFVELLKSIGAPGSIAFLVACVSAWSRLAIRVARNTALAYVWMACVAALYI